jgi:predicted nucleotidyltransferase
VNISTAHLNSVNKILSKHISGYEVWAFGSRVTGTNKPHSDLDLLILNEQPLDPARVASLRESFSESDIPFKVDVLEKALASESFMRVIKQNYSVIQKP